MTLPELWGWVEVLLRNLGIWEYLTGAISVMIIVSISFWVIGRFSR